jgi:hypothetical protein
MSSVPDLDPSPLPAAQTVALIEDAIAFTAVRTGEHCEYAMIVYDAYASTILGRDNYRLTTPFKFYVGPRENELWAYLPAGFLSDGATVPRFLYWLVPPWGRHGEAAMVHDYLCEHLTLYHHGQPIPITRSRADQIFGQAMRVSQVHPVIRGLMYGAVRFYTWYARSLQDRMDPNYRRRKSELEANYEGLHALYPHSNALN